MENAMAATMENTTADTMKNTTMFTLRRRAASGKRRAVVLIFLLWHRSTKSSDRQQDKSTGSTELLQSPMPYSYNDLKIATNNFSKEHKLGEGTFGVVVLEIISERRCTDGIENGSVTQHLTDYDETKRR
ncbi:hypothetical protein L6452_17159 [Arctium lappa]|uniref:Uncharacterized protein n=1 Tax=Arctium lappa TaxID=4217 RepID=A0ACB9C2I1_ARCLA|nr:hypothetical protein L6452_17159 [Arctium lappa]